MSNFYFSLFFQIEDIFIRQKRSEMLFNINGENNVIHWVQWYVGTFYGWAVQIAIDLVAECSNGKVPSTPLMRFQILFYIPLMMKEDSDLLFNPSSLSQKAFFLLQL